MNGIQQNKRDFTLHRIINDDWQITITKIMKGIKGSKEVIQD